MKKITYLLCLTLLIGSCKKDESVQDIEETGITKELKIATQSNLANNIIIPAYQNLENKLIDLVAKKDQFIENVSQENLDALRTSWSTAYFAWQHVEMYNIGKADEIKYREKMNIYPTNTSYLENKILTGEYDLMSFNSNDSVGFPALDYLLFGVADNNTNILAKYNNESYRQYLSDVIDQMKELTTIVLSDWEGNYKNQFINSVENTSTSANNKLLNSFVYHYEKVLRANKVGIPAGVFSSNPLPNTVEALYNNEISKGLLLESLKSFKDVYMGKSFEGNTTGEGYKSLLETIGKTELSQSIIDDLDDAIASVELLDESLKNQVETDNMKMLEAYVKIQKVTRLLKLDMLQAFNVSVDYQDADGD